MKPPEFFQRLKKGDPDPVYFFIGEELYLKNKAINEILKVISEEQRDFNTDVFQGGETDLADVLAAARTLPFLAPRRVVVFREIERSRIAAPGADRLVGYLKDPSPETVLVVTSQDRNAGRSWSKKGAGLWTEVDFRPLRGAALSAAVREAAGARGVRITAEAVERLAETAGNDLSRINQELDKLSLAAGEGGEIDGPAVTLMVGGYAYQTAFDLVQAVCNRDIRESLVLIGRLFVSGGEATGLIGMLAKRLRALWYLCPGDKGRPGPVPAAFRLQKWQVADLTRQATRYTRGEIEGMLGDLLAIDSLLKSAPVSARLLLEDFVLALERRGSETSLPARPRPAS